MVIRPGYIKGCLVHLWRFILGTKDLNMHSFKPASIDYGSLVLNVYVDASFASGGGRSRSGLAMYLVNPKNGTESLIQWASRRQTSMATSAPEAEVSAMAEGYATSIFLFDTLSELGLVSGSGPSALMSMKTDSAVALKQLGTQSVTVRTRTAAQKLNYLRELIYENPQVEPIYISGDSQRADGLTKILSGKSLSDSQESLNLLPSTPLITGVQEERVSTVQNDVHAHMLKDTQLEADAPRVCTFRMDRQDESSSLDSNQDESRIPLRYSTPQGHTDPARATRIRDLVSMLHPPSRMVQSGTGKRGRKQPPGGEAPGDQSRQTSEAGTAGSGPRQSDLREQARLRALQNAVASQSLNAPPSTKVARHESRSMESSSATQPPVNLAPQGSSMETEPVIPSVEVDESPKSSDPEMISSPHTRSIDLEEEDEEEEEIPQSWEQRTGASLNMEALIELEKEGIAEEDFAKSWARMQDINDVELEKKNPPIDRSRVQTYRLNPELLEAPQESSFKKPTADLPAWKIRKQFVEKLSACKLLIVKAPTGSGKSTIFPALAAKTMPKERIWCTQVKRSTTESVCGSTQRMWKRTKDDRVVGYRHGTAVKQNSESDSTRILFCTEGIARNEILSLDRKRHPHTAMKGTRILLVDEAHSNNVDTELVISAILCRLNGLSDFKLVLMSATLDIATFYRKARDAGVSRDAVDHLSLEERMMPVEINVLPPSIYPRDNLELAVRAVIQFHNTNAKEYKQTYNGTILVFVPGKSEITLVIKMITDLQNRGHTANLYPYGFHAELPMKDKEMLTKYPIEDRDEKGNLTNRRRMMQLSATGENWNNEGANLRTTNQPVYTNWSERTVIVATNAAETGVTFENCMYVVDTCLVNIVYYDPSAAVKVQATVVCSKAAAAQRAGRTGRNCAGQCLRLVTQEQWNKMPKIDPVQPRMQDHSELYLRLSLPSVRDLRNTLMGSLSMTRSMRARSNEKLFLMGMIDRQGELTSMGTFAADLGCQPENAAFLWHARKLEVMEDALTIFAMLERGQALVAKERRVKVPHPDGDLHSLLNVWHSLQWLDHRTHTLAPKVRESHWTKEKVSLRTYTIVKEFRAEIATKCEGVLKTWPTARDETTNTRLALALFKAYKLSLMIRNASGQYSSVMNDDDEWRFGSKESRSSVLKFKPQFIIVPGRMVRIQALGPKDCGAEARIDLAMPVPWEFLTSEMWYCTNCCRNPLFQQVLREIKDLPILSNMIIMERLCPAIGVNPIPRVRDYSATILPTNAKKLMRPMKWVYDRPLNMVVKQAHNYRADVPIKAGATTIVDVYTIPTVEIDYYTLQFGDAVDAKSDETGGAPDKVSRNDARIVVDKLCIIPPFSSNAGVLDGWMKNVANLPKDVRPAFKDKLLIGEHHQATAVDLIHAGADGGELDAAQAEKEEEAVDDNNTTIDQYPVHCDHSVLVDDKDHVLNDYRTMVYCPFCEQEALTGSPVEWKSRKLHAFTTHVRLEHDFVAYPSTRGYTYQQLIGGRQAHAAQQWYQSELINQERTDKNGQVHRWRERKIKRSISTDEKNGDLQPVIYTPFEPRAEHTYSPKAVPSSQPNKHLMIRDDYPEVLGAEMSAIHGKQYFIPKTGPEAVASWSTRLSRDTPSVIYQMDPLSSPNDLSPIHMAKTPIMWMTPADMKIFLRPQDESLEDTWKKAMTLLCFVVMILRDCCEFTDFRQTSFGSTYMTLLGFAQVMHVTMPMHHATDETSAVFKKSREGLYFTLPSQQELSQKWEELRHQCVIQKGPEIQGLSYNMERIIGIAFDGSVMNKDTCGLAVVDDQLTLVTDVILEKGIEAVTEVAGLIQLKETYVRDWVVAYDLYRLKFNKEKPMRAALGDTYQEAWDSWPEKVWKSDNDSVVLVQTDIRQEKQQRTQGIMQCVWNNVRALVGTPPTLETTAIAVKEEESEGTTEQVRRPEFFTGDLPLNAVVELSAFNRPDQSAFIEAVNIPPPGYEEEPGAKRVMPDKAPFAFEWPANKGWNAQTRLGQRISLEQNKDPKIWTTPPGVAAKTVESELTKLTAVKWNKKGATEIYTRAAGESPW